MHNLDDLRKEIDHIDKKLVSLFERRMEIVSEIAAYKIQNNISIEDSSRENDVLQKNIQYLNNSIFKESLMKFFNALMKISKEFQDHF
ncbi:MAG: chorismate mutase [Alkaliphilus sp.]|mgnify:CR=1 FL=1|nr:chorismate mutase [Alkaliphilus sp.]